MLASTALDWAPAAAAVFAAFAAAAAWATVRLNYRQWRASRLPELRGQMVRRERTGKIELTILNAGAGVARGVGFCAVYGGEYVAGFAGQNMGGFLKPGERTVVETDLTHREDPKYVGVVTCDDVAGCYHSWSIHPVGHRVWKTPVLRRPRKDYPSGAEALAHHHPEIDLSKLVRVGGRTRLSDSEPPRGLPRGPSD
jgi:hypothetical protein